MTITTLIGLTGKQYDRAREEYDHEYFQLKEIVRHYEARMYRREQKRKIMRKLTFDTPCDYEKYCRRLAKLNELDSHNDRDRKRWDAGMDRCIALSTRWNAMIDELERSKKS